MGREQNELVSTTVKGTEPESEESEQESGGNEWTG